MIMVRVATDGDGTKYANVIDDDGNTLVIEFDHGKYSVCEQHGNDSTTVCTGDITATELTPSQKWEALRTYLLESVAWYEQMQQPREGADMFVFFLKQGTTNDILAHMMYLDGKDTEDTRMLIALLGNPCKTRVRAPKWAIREIDDLRNALDDALGEIDDLNDDIESLKNKLSTETQNKLSTETRSDIMDFRKQTRKILYLAMSHMMVSDDARLRSNDSPLIASPYEEGILVWIPDMETVDGMRKYGFSEMFCHLMERVINYQEEHDNVRYILFDCDGIEHPDLMQSIDGNGNWI